jgi:hypothetical protein
LSGVIVRHGVAEEFLQVAPGQPDAWSAAIAA